MRKRDRLGVIHDILRTIRDKGNSIRPTPLLRFSNLSTQSFNDYMKELVEKGFVKELIDTKGKRTITLTDTGFRYLEKYRMITGFIEEFEL